MKDRFDANLAERALGDLFEKVTGLGRRKVDKTRQGVFLSEQFVGNRNSWTSSEATREVLEHYEEIARKLGPTE